jgi:hypothetical protein
VTSSPAGPRVIAWTGAAVFAGSLLFFLYTYLVTFGAVAAGPLRIRDVMTNAGLLTAFALHHSLFARGAVRAWVARTAPAALERSLYVWVASLMFIAVCWLWRPLPGVVWQLNGAAAWLPPLAQLAGAWLTLRSAAAIDIWELAGVKQVGSPKAQSPNSKFQSGSRAPDHESPFRTDGAYGWVRHPIYLGWFFLVFGVGTMTMTRLSFALISCIYIVIAIPFEERSLRRTAGDAYETYRRHVPWKLIPYVY